jgi:nucleotide-binding universal stress UspA family protein
MFSKILVCNDGSEHAMRAARAAAELAKKFGSAALVLSVIPPVPVLAPYVMAMDAAPDMSGLRLEAEQEHRAALACVEALYRAEAIPVRTLAEEGHAVEVISRVAEEEKVDLIVLGSRGMGGFQRFLLGSVSDGVAHHAHCPVLIVR